MIHINQAVVVEGKYDKIHLSQFIDAVIIAVNGFQIFNDKDKQELIKYYAKTTGIVIMTDSDSAGMMIRGRIKSLVGNAKVFNAYVPEVFGKEKRKLSPSKEGKLGVEGIEPELIIQALEQCGISACERSDKERITMQDFIADGISGGENSSAVRQRLLKEINMPISLSSKALLEVLNVQMTREQYSRLIEKISG